MKTIVYSGLGLLLLSIFVMEASSIKCYVCSSVEDMGCGHGADADSKHIMDCDGPVNPRNPELGPGQKFTICRKIISTVAFDVNDNKAGQRIKRTCGWDDEDTKYINSCYYRGGLGGRSDVCSCDKDTCNDGPLIQATTLTVLLPVALLTLWRLFC